MSIQVNDRLFSGLNQVSMRRSRTTAFESRRAITGSLALGNL